jgi:hypothetical protein
VVLERGSLNLLSTIEKLLERKNSGSGLEKEIIALGDPPRWPGYTLHAQKVGSCYGDSYTFYFFTFYIGARGSVVVKALCYKPEGRGFETRLGAFLNLPNPSGRTRPWGLLNL